MIYLYILLSCEWKGFCMFFYYYCCCSWYMFYMNFLTVWYLFMRKCLSVCWSKTEKKKSFRFGIHFVKLRLKFNSCMIFFGVDMIKPGSSEILFCLFERGSKRGDAKVKWFELILKDGSLMNLCLLGIIAWFEWIYSI